VAAFLLNFLVFIFGIFIFFVILKKLILI